MTYFAFIISVLMGVGSLAYAYSSIGFDIVAQILIAFGVFWLYAGWRRWTWFSTIGILLSVSLAGFGLYIELSPGWMIAGALGGLMAWDLSDFMRRIYFAPDSADLPAMQRRHLARLTIVATIGVALSSISMAVRLEFTLESMMLLALVAVLGVTQLVGWLRR